MTKPAKPARARPRKPSLTWVGSMARKVYGRRAVETVNDYNLDGKRHRVEVRLRSDAFMPSLIATGVGSEEACEMALAALRVRLDRSDKPEPTVKETCPECGGAGIVDVSPFDIFPGPASPGNIQVCSRCSGARS